MVATKLLFAPHGSPWVLKQAAVSIPTRPRWRSGSPLSLVPAGTTLRLGGGNTGGAA